MTAVTPYPTKPQAPLTGDVGELIAALGDVVVQVEQCTPRRGFVRIEPENTVAVSRKLSGMPGARFITITGIDVRDGIDLLYHWAFDRQGVVLTVKALAARPEIAAESVALFITAANWIEREIHDLLGVTFRGHPDMRRLILDDSWPEGVYPLRKDFDQIADRPPLPPIPPAPEEGQL